MPETMFMNIEQFKTPFVFFDNAIGDSFIALPALRALSKLTDGRMSLITCVDKCGKINYTIFQELALKNIYGIKIAETEKGKEFDPEELADLLKHADLFIYMNTWMLSPDKMKWLFDTFHPKTSVGFYKYMTLSLPFSKEVHSADLLFRFPQCFDKTLSIEDYSYPPPLPIQVNEFIADIKQKLPEDIRLLVIHADTKPDKSWPFQNYRLLLDKLMEKYPEIVVVFVGVKLPDVKSCKYYNRILEFGQALPFIADWAFVSIADVFLGIDSAFLHIADLYQVPAISLFGPTTPLEWGIRFSKYHRCLAATHQQMENITVEDVYESFCDLWNE